MSICCLAVGLHTFFVAPDFEEANGEKEQVMTKTKNPTDETHRATSPRSLRHPAKQPSRFWMLLSVALSLCILAWAFSLPLRHGTMPTQATTTPVSASASRQMQLEHRRQEAERYREYARALDRDLLDAQRQKDTQWKTQWLPGEKEVSSYWSNYRQRLTDEIEQLRDVEPGTLQYERRQHLITELSAPR
ncbi:hypothetical protein [Novipirellula artificiosorum]|uniref:Uncharacterized protein n=1 Tax=Novipirellula artificiosorum TaxID=2528016 RepID=A0A5C6DWJ8_9BACT|nr:hypothetical protein [Novipirellula artificiosorum]TWU40735.1 hypothetical protein Poly41_15700 [Novipirellula artificiosorum]